MMNKAGWLTVLSVMLFFVYRLTPALAMKHGYDSVEEYVAGAQKKFSLLENGILDMPSTRLLLVNVSFFFPAGGEYSVRLGGGES